MGSPAVTGVRIGEVCRRVGITPDRLRAWERRYGLAAPERSKGGYRLYSEADEARIRRMLDLIGRGYAAAEAARLAVEEPPGGAADPRALLVELEAALDGFDDLAAQDVLDRLFATADIDVAVRDVILPYLRRLGERWSAGDVSVGQEHFASTLLSGRLQGMARRWSRGAGPLALLACLPGEHHELGLLCFGLALRARGWRIAYLGSDLPVDDLAATARQLGPDVVVVSATTPEVASDSAVALAAVSAVAPLAIGGAAATPAIGLRTGARLLRDDVVSAADQVTAARAA